MPVEKPKVRDMDEPVKIDLDPEVALGALLAVDPETDPAESEPETEKQIRGPKPRPRPKP
jgi:hypothetical protein